MENEKPKFKNKFDTWIEKHPRLFAAGVWTFGLLLPVGAACWLGYDAGKRQRMPTSKMVHEYLMQNTKPGYIIHEDGVRLDLFHDDGAHSHLEMSKESDMTTWDWPV